MPTVVLDLELQQRLQAERAATGADRYDEVWEGTYMMAPMPNDEHQQLVSRFVAIFQDVLDWAGRADVRPGVNVSDRIEQWQSNFRVPDVAVFFKEGIAENRGAFWRGGPDFAVEITCPEDQTRSKLPFYESVSVRELLVVERQPWSLELFRLDGGRFVVAGRSDLDRPDMLHSAVIPFTFRLVAGDERPRIEVTHLESGKRWLA